MGNVKSCCARYCCCCCSSTCCKNGKRKKNENLGLHPMARRMNSDDKYSDGGVDEVDNGPTTLSALSIRRVDLCLEENGSNHHTWRFDAMSRDSLPSFDNSHSSSSQLVVRRGQPFRLKLTCNRPYNRSTDGLSFVFTVSDDVKPTFGHGTLVPIALSKHAYQLGDAMNWGAAIESINGDILTVLIKPSAQAPVTQWKVDIDTKDMETGTARTFSLQRPIFLLFNPWCEDDQVYLPNGSELEEYVLSDTTLIYRGSYNRIRPSVWKLGQFERDVLECALYLVSHVGKVKPAQRGDPVKISRAISAAVNSPDDLGCVMGRWDDDFSGGTAPTKWVGSVEIMQKFFAKKKPVKYGQCWVFAGVLSTVARAIGIPSRIITNYSSAHDTQASLTVDYFEDSDGKALEEFNSDSIWNYHVWNEVWMRRPDMGTASTSRYDGWQAIDATPQEPSDDQYRCGPASVAAVKLGEVQKPYDCNFLYSEVNADKLFWRYTGPAQPLKLLNKDVYGIGLFISTKAIGEWEREDVTSSYKFAEKTEDERSTMFQALSQTDSAYSRYYLNEEFNEIQFVFHVLEDIVIGQDFNVTLEVRNKSAENVHTVEGALNVDTVLYTGNNRLNIKRKQFEVRVQPKTVERVQLEVAFEEYFGKLLPQSAFNISCMAKVKGTEYDYFAEDDFRVRKPDIKISFQGKGDVVSREPVEVLVKLKNPLPVVLRKGVFHIEGPGLEKALEFKVSEVAVKGDAEVVFEFVPPYSGRGTFAAKFTSKELDDVDGFLAFEMQPRPEDILTPNWNRDYNNVISRTDVVA